MKVLTRKSGGSGGRVFGGVSLDLLTVDDEIAVGVSGRTAIIWELSGVDVFMRSDGDVDQIYRGLENLFHHLPPSMGLQLFIRQRSGSPDGDPDLSPPWKEREEALDQGPSEKLFREEAENSIRTRFVRKRALFLALVSYEQKKKSLLAPSWYPVRTFSTTSDSRVFSELRKSLVAFRKAASVIEALLPGCGLWGTPLRGERLARHLFSRVNPLWKGPLPEKLLSLSAHSGFREHIFQTSFKEESGCLEAVDPSGRNGVGFMHALRLLPYEVDRETLSPLIHDLVFSYDMAMNIWKPSGDRLVKKVQSDATLNRFLTYLLPGRSYRIESEIESAETFLERSYEGPVESRVPLVVNMTLSHWSEDLETAVFRGDQVTQCFASMNGAMAGVEPDRQWPLFLSLLPLQGDANDRWEGLLSRELSRILPVWDGVSQDDTPWFQGKNHLSEWVGIDLWRPSDPNHNGLVVGRSGGGKSFGIKMLVGQFLMHSHRHQAIIVENGGDFERHCLFFGGDYVRIDLSGRFSLNPFPERRFLLVSQGPPREYEPDLLGFICGVVETFLSPSMAVTSVHRRILAICIEEVYDQLPGDEERPVLSHLSRELFRFRGRDREDEETGYRMGKVLESWVGGMYGPLLNRGSGLSHGGRLVAFDLSGLEHHESLKAVVFAYIAGLSLWRLMSGQGEKRLYLIFDEAHRILETLRGTSFLSHLYRTVRKYGGGVIAISQSPADFIGEDLSPAILNNTSWKWTFPVEGSDEDLLRYGLSPREIEMVGMLERDPGDFSETLFSRQDRSIILRLEPSRLEYWLSARSPEEDQVVRESAELHGGFLNGLQRLIEEME